MFYFTLDVFDLGYEMSIYIQNSLVAVLSKCGSYELKEYISNDIDDLFCVKPY